MWSKVGAVPQAGAPRSAALMGATLLLAAALFMFVDRRTTPIILWDESRLAINAIEMFERGWSLTTTYGFEPDLWNTKPPLMIWLMNASVHAFGPSESALRLPSMIAGLGTLALVFGFVRRATRSLPTAALAVVLLATSVGFYGEHGARTADYDALLCFFTTAYLRLFHVAVHQVRPGWQLLGLAFAAVAAAALTKTVAGLVPGVGVVFYLLLCGRWRRVAMSPSYAILLLLALVPLACFYLLREADTPGFFAAAWYNDVAGRLRDHLEPVEAKPWYYVQTVFQHGLFSAGPLALLAPVGLWGATGRSRQALLFALCCVAGQFAVVTITATKLSQYMLPALPWLAIACAITAKERLPSFLGHGGAVAPSMRALLLPSALIAAAVINIGVRTVTMRYDLLLERAWQPQASYGLLFAALHAHGVRDVTIVDPGFRVDRIETDHPQLRYYTMLWRGRGMVIDRQVALRDAQQTGAIVASCDPRTATGVLVPRGGRMIGAPGCAAIMPRPTSAAA